jgi:hypothetical protein
LVGATVDGVGGTHMTTKLSPSPSASKHRGCEIADAGHRGVVIAGRLLKMKTRTPAANHWQDTVGELLR